MKNNDFWGKNILICCCNFVMHLMHSFDQLYVYISDQINALNALKNDNNKFK